MQHVESLAIAKAKPTCYACRKYHGAGGQYTIESAPVPVVPYDSRAMPPTLAYTKEWRQCPHCKGTGND